jgi:hypothetical protein
VLVVEWRCGRASAANETAVALDNIAKKLVRAEIENSSISVFD